MPFGDQRPLSSRYQQDFEPLEAPGTGGEFNPVPTLPQPTTGGGVGPPGPPGPGVPVGGATGQVLTKQSATDYDTIWTTLAGLPAGGTTGQALLKNSNTSYDATWQTIAQLTAGGAAGQFLRKNSATNFDAAWVDIAQLTAGGTTGQVLTKNSATNFDASWQTPAASSGLPAGGGIGAYLGKKSATNYDAEWKGAFVTNIVDYGAVGNDSTDNSLAISNAITAALASNRVLYVPKGIFRTSTVVLTSVTNFAIVGEGRGVSVLKSNPVNWGGAIGISGTQVLNIQSSSYINVRGITFDGNCTKRTPGQQAVIWNASYSSFCDCEILRSGEFAFYAGGDSAITDLIVSRNFVHLCYADGLNFYNVDRFVMANNVVDGCDDDGIALGFAKNGVVADNYVRPRNDLGTNWGRGIWASNSRNIVIGHNFVTGSKQTGLYLNSEFGIPENILVIGNTFFECALYSGHGMEVDGVKDCTLEDNTVLDPVHGNCLEIADWNNLVVRGGNLVQRRDQFCRGIHANENSGGFLSTTWTRLLLDGVHINMQGALTNSCIYLNPHSSITMSIGAVTGIKGAQVAGGDYILLGTARMSTLWKLGNNVALSANTVNPSASTGITTVFNNN